MREQTTDQRLTGPLYHALASGAEAINRANGMLRAQDRADRPSQRQPAEGQPPRRSKT